MGGVYTVSQVVVFRMFLNFLDDVTQVLFIGLLTGLLFFFGIVLGAYLWGLFFWIRSKIGVSHQLGLNLAVASAALSERISHEKFLSYCSSGTSSTAEGLLSIVSLSPYLWQSLAALIVLAVFWRLAVVSVFVGCVFQSLILIFFLKHSEKLFDKYQECRMARQNFESLLLKDFDMIRGSNRLELTLDVIRDARREESLQLVKVNSFYLKSLLAFMFIGSLFQWLALMMILVLPPNLSSSFTSSNLAPGLVACSILSSGLLTIAPYMMTASFGFSDFRSYAPQSEAVLQPVRNLEEDIPSNNLSVQCKDAVWLGIKYVEEKIICAVCFNVIENKDALQINNLSVHASCVPTARQKQLNAQKCHMCDMIVPTSEVVEKNGLFFHGKCLKSRSTKALDSCDSCNSALVSLPRRCKNCRKLFCNSCVLNWNEGYVCKKVCLKKIGTVCGPLTCAIPKGSFVNIFGPPKCGKSNLLRGIMGEQERLSGQCTLQGSCSYSGSALFVVPGLSVRENILFGSDFLENRYLEVVQICELDFDFQQFGGGDEMLLDESGSNVSGGQLRRICLARALYAESSCVFLDDPFVGLDPKTSDSVKERLFKFQNGNVTLFITSETPFPQCSYKIEMDNLGATTFREEHLQDGIIQDQIEEIRKENDSELSSPTRKDEHCSPEKNVLIVAFKAVSSIFWLSVAFLFLSSCCWVFLAFCWSFWLNSSFGLSQQSWGFIYLSAVVLFYFLFLVAAHFMTTSTVFPGTFLQNRALEKISSSVAFSVSSNDALRTTFLNDFSVVDKIFVSSLSGFFQRIFSLVGTLVLVGFSFPIALSVLPIIVILFVLVVRSYTRGFLSVNKALFNRLSEFKNLGSSIVQGALYVKIFQVGGKFLKMLETKAKNHALILFLKLFFPGFIIVFLPCIASIEILACILVGIFLFRVGSLGGDIAFASYALAQAVELPDALMFCFKEFGETLDGYSSFARFYNIVETIPQRSSKNDFESVELSEFSKLKVSELTVEISGKMILENVSLEIDEGKIVAFIGRTGAGKSSLLKSFMFPEIWKSGEVLLSGTSLARLSENSIRKLLSACPQFPIYFNGSVLENVGSQEAVDILRELGYNFQAEDEVRFGSLSTSQVTAFGLARALASADSKVILLDECVTKVDEIQVVRKHQRNRIVCIVLHHLEISGLFDQVFVFQKGQLSQEGHARELVKQEGIFREMFKAMDAENQELFISLSNSPTNPFYQDVL